MEISSPGGSYRKYDVDIRKTIHILIEDLNTHIYLLDDAIARHQKHPAHFIQMATQLRTLVTKAKGGDIDLLPFIGRVFNEKLQIILTSPQSRGQVMTFDAYLCSLAVKLNQEKFNRLKFIKLMCNDGGSYLHVSETQSGPFLTGKNFVFSGIDANNKMLLCIARTTSSVAHDLLTRIRGMSNERISRVNNKHLENGKKTNNKI